LTSSLARTAKALAARVVAALAGGVVPLQAWSRMARLIVGHVQSAGREPERLALFALPLLGMLPEPHRSLPPAELTEVAVGLAGLNAEEGALTRAALEAAFGG
jgi:hypothetical protein